MTFDGFLKELHADSPELDLTLLEDALRDIECEDDDLALALFEAVRWTVRQKCSVRMRLAFIAHLFNKATAPAPQALQ